MDATLVVDPRPYDVVLTTGDASQIPTLASFAYGSERTLVVPTGTPVPDEVARQPAWRHITVEAELPFDVIGFFRRFADALADARVPILPFASYRFDHVLVPAERLADALAAMQTVIDADS